MPKQMCSKSLWDGSNLIIAPALVEVYSNSIQSAGLWEMTQEPRPDPAPIGGISREQTNEHFAHCFDGSVARVQLVQLDPLDDMPNASTELLRLLVGGDVCLVDAPSGAGAGALSLLANIATLRNEDCLPRQPLNIRLIWAEISEPAREFASEMLLAMNDELQAAAIFVTVDEVSWDILDDVSNHNLVEKIAQTRVSHPQTLLVVCAFSGFLHRGGKLKEAEENLKGLIRFCSGDMNAAIWIEPDMAAVKKEFVERLVSLFGKLVGFLRVIRPSEPTETSRVRFVSPLVDGLKPRVGAVVLSAHLDRET